MFGKATTRFVTEIDPDGGLVPVSSLNQSDDLTLLSLVIKRESFWFWQKSKYITSDFSLNDILVGDKDIDPAVNETDFLKYSSTLENNNSGVAEADFGPGHVNLEVQGSSKLASSFGNLTKMEVDIRRLLDYSKNRVLDLQHCLVRQTREKRRKVLGVVKERIVTTQPCTISEVVHQAESCGAVLGFTVPRTIQVSVKNGSHQSASSVSLEIPAKTTLAYSLIELRVKSTGHFDLCVLPDNSGGFETDGGEKGVSVVYSTPPETPNKQIQEELDRLQAQFQTLSELPSSTRSSLFQQISILLKDRAAISTLDLALEDMCCGKNPDLGGLDEIPSERSVVQTTLDLLQEEEVPGEAQVDSTSSAKWCKLSAITATYVLSSALEEMSDSVLSVLESCCCSPVIQALNVLVQHAVENRTCSLKHSGLAIMEDEDTYRRVVELFGSCGVALSKEDESISADLSSQQEHMPLILCIAICALASLAPPI